MDVQQREKQLNIVLRLGEDVLKSPSLSDDDRTKLEGDCAMLKRRWENLTEKAQKSQKRYNRLCLCHSHPASTF